MYIFKADILQYCIQFNPTALRKAKIAFRKAKIVYKSVYKLTLLHSERPKLYTILAFLSAIGLTQKNPEQSLFCETTQGLLLLKADITLNKSFPE